MTEIRQEYNTIKFIEFRPDGYDENKAYPVIFYTHGAGTRGDDLDLVKTNYTILRAKEYVKDAIIVAPQCNANTWFDVFERLSGLVKHIYERPTTDKDRFYGIGISMGGYCMYALMQSMPELFAAGIICCGGGMYWNAERLKNIPLKIFHGKLDDVVFPEESERMAARINAVGGHAELTLYDGIAHHSWEPSLSDKNNFEWLLSKKRGG